MAPGRSLPTGMGRKIRVQRPPVTRTATRRRPPDEHGALPEEHGASLEEPIQGLYMPCSRILSRIAFLPAWTGIALDNPAAVLSGAAAGMPRPCLRPATALDAGRRVCG
jgi:hypothetical protein